MMVTMNDVDNDNVNIGLKNILFLLNVYTNWLFCNFNFNYTNEEEVKRRKKSALKQDKRFLRGGLGVEKKKNSISDIIQLVFRI